MRPSVNISDDTEKILTLDDLRQWRRNDPSLAVVGKPVGHSLSPRMHNAALAELSRTLPHFGNWRYFKFEIDPSDLQEAMALFHKKKFLGVNLTLPHKVIALDFATGCSKISRVIGAINTLIWHHQGYYGHNTDGAGFARGIHEELNVAIKGAHIVLLGAGGAARALASVSLQENCRELWIINRDPERLGGLVKQLRKCLPNDTARLRAFTTKDFPEKFPADSVIVNATRLGLKKNDTSPFPKKLFTAGMAAYDTIYEPRETQFLRDAREAGIHAGNGLSMLCWQGALSLELWTRIRAPVRAMANALNLPNIKNDTDAS